jgi:hypothetical protein
MRFKLSNRQVRQERQWKMSNTCSLFLLGVLGALGGSLFLCGCQSPRAGKPLAKEFAGSDPDAQLNFWHALTDEPIASNDQAFHALLLYVDNKDDSTDYGARVAALKRREMLPAKFASPADAGVTRGTVAVAMMRILNERGGVTTRVFGPSPRYAVRELMFLNVIPASTPNQALSGNELVGIIGRLEDYQRGNPANVPAAVLPGEMK